MCGGTCEKRKKLFVTKIQFLLRGRSQLSTFMKAYTAYAYARGRESGATVRFPPENQHLFVITDNVL